MRLQTLCRWALALACASPALALAESDFEPVQGKAFVVKVDTQRPVSGQTVVGLVVGPIRYAEELWVRVPKVDRSASLRVEVDSPDGRFYGTGLFRGERERTDWARVPLAPKPDDEVDLTELAASALLMPAGGGKRQPLLVTWDRPNVGEPWQRKTLHVMVNSRRATRLSAMVARTSKPVAHECKRVASPRVKRFDMVCQLPMTELMAQGRPSATLRLLRHDGFDVEQFDVEIPL